MVEHQTTLVKNLHVDKLTMTEVSTRYKNDLNLPRCRLKTGQRSFALTGGAGGGGGGATCWNKLPKNVKEVADCRNSKKRLMNMFLK